MIVGFIGLGTMGGPMARNLLAKGHRVIVSDVQPAAVRALTEAGATHGRDTEGRRRGERDRDHDAARRARRRASRARPRRHRRGHPAGGVYIDMSTIDPATTRKVGAAIAAKGATMIDSPVGQTADHAVAGTLTLMVGGPAEVVARCREVLDCMGTDFFHCGDLGAGQTMKLLNNLLAAAVGEASVEALVTGTKAGLTLDTMMSVFRTTMAWNNQLAIAMPKRSLVGDFKPGFMMKLAHKDCRLALKMVDALGVAAPVGRAGSRAWRKGSTAACRITMWARCSSCARSQRGSRFVCAPRPSVKKRRSCSARAEDRR